MPVNQSFDSLQFPDLAFPYDRIRGELMEEPPRLVEGQNTYITSGGKLARRPGTSALTSNTLNYRIDRLWLYETLDTPPCVYLIASAYNHTSTRWELWYQRLSNPVGVWTQAPSLRQINSSTAPHEGTSGRGLFYVKGIPTGASGEKLGGVILDGTGGTIVTRPWGMLGPTIPARLEGFVTDLRAAVNASTTSWMVGSIAGFPTLPFVIQADYERVNVTGLVGSGPYNLTVTRGYDGTFAASHAAYSTVLFRPWVESVHANSIFFGWQYSYAWKSTTGQLSNRAPAETNPDNVPSVSGPFINRVPAIVVRGHVDTTNYPTIVIFRTTDGGGTYYVLDEIANPGDISVVYSDNKLASNSGNRDPIPDVKLTRNDFGPSLTSNSPPPTVNAPLTVGVDTPVKTSPVAYYQGRIWYAIGNVLHYSGGAEVINGIGEESFPSGIKGNFFRFQHPITNLVSTTNALYIYTLQHTHALTGSNRETFSTQPVFENFGSPYGHPRAAVRFGEYFAFLTHDCRVAVGRGDTVKVISEALGTDLINAVEAGAEVELCYWADTDKQFLVVAAHNKANPTLSRQFVCDLTRTFGETLENFNAKTDGFWFTPWTIPSVAMLAGRISEGSNRRHLLFQVWDEGGKLGRIVRLDPAVTTDALAAGVTKFDATFTTNLFTIPPGNHVNRLRVPYLAPILHSIFIERTLTSGDTDPELYFFADDIYTSPIPLRPEKPASRAESVGYKTIEGHANHVLHRVALRVDKLGSADPFELQNIIFTFNPDSGR